MPSQTKSDVHITPDVVFELINTYWGYKKQQLFDPCPVNPQWDGLKIPWHKLNYVNPPYTLLEEFVSKAYWESLKGNITIMLLPSTKTDKPYFHDIIVDHRYEIKFIRGRLKFKNNKWQAPQPHFLVRIKQ